MEQPMICSELTIKIFYFAIDALHAGFEQVTVYILYVFSDIYCYYAIVTNLFRVVNRKFWQILKLPKNYNCQL